MIVQRFSVVICADDCWGQGFPLVMIRSLATIDVSAAGGCGDWCRGLWTVTVSDVSVWTVSVRVSLWTVTVSVSGFQCGLSLCQCQGFQCGLSLCQCQGFSVDCHSVRVSVWTVTVSVSGVSVWNVTVSVSGVSEWTVTVSVSGVPLWIIRGFIVLLAL